MDSYKLHTGISPTYKITIKEDFEKQTGQNKEYFDFGEDGIKRGLAVCPACDNPIRILGLYKTLKTQKPYAKHHNKSTAFAAFDRSAYYHCPKAYPNNEYGHIDYSSKSRTPTEYEKKMYYAVRDYFDKIVYILNQDLSIKISLSFAEKLLKEFVKNKGYMNHEASLYNLPWVLLDRIFSFNLIGMQIKRNSNLWNVLNKMSKIALNPYSYKDKNGKIIKSDYDIIQSNSNDFVVLIGHFIHHIRKNVGDKLVESISFGVSDSDEVPVHWIFTEKYEINQHRFPNLCAKKETYRNEKLLELAKKIMPDI